MVNSTLTSEGADIAVKPPRTCRNVALDLLARREHSHRELVRKLSQRGFETEEIESALQRLVEDGLLSNERFAEAYVSQRVSKGYGPLRIRQELRERGLSDAEADVALAPWRDQWFDVAARQYKKRFGDEGVADVRDKARRMRYLQARGFGFEMINELISD